MQIYAATGNLIDGLEPTLDIPVGRHKIYEYNRDSKPESRFIEENSIDLWIEHTKKYRNKRL